MATDESIGSVVVNIGGDYAPLVAAFGQAQTIARNAGASVASAFSGGAGAAPGIVDQFGRAVQSAGSASATAAPQVGALSAQTAGLAQNATQAANALAKQASAAHAGVTEIQATSGALRVLEGSGGIRAAERFLTMIPGLGAALQMAFPLIGAVALGEAVVHIVEKVSELVGKWSLVGIAERDAKAAAEEYGASAVKIAEELQRLSERQVTRQAGPVAGQANEANNLEQQARIKQAQADAFKSDLAIQQAKYDASQAALKSVFSGTPGTAATAEASRLATQAAAAEAEVRNLKSLIGQAENEAAGLRAKSAFSAQGSLGAQHQESTEAANKTSGVNVEQIQATQEANARLTQISEDHVKQQTEDARRIQQIGIESISSEAGRRDAADQADIQREQSRRTALRSIYEQERTDKQAASEGILKAQTNPDTTDELQRQAARIAYGKRNSDDDADLARKKQELDANVARDQDKLQADQAAFARRVTEEQLADFRNIGDGWEKLQQQLQEGAKKWGEEMTRASEISAKGSAETDALKVQQQKIALEGQYGQQVSHTLQQQIDYLRTIAELELEESDAKIADLERERQIAAAAGDIVRAAQAEAQINTAIQQRANTQTQAANQIGKAQQTASVGNKIGGIAESGLNSMASAVARGVFDGGKGLGKDLRESLKGIGEQLFGTLLKESVDQLIIAITGQTIATNLNTVWLAIKSLLGFADGGSPPLGVPSIVGERGPEIFVPHEAGAIIPNHMLKGYADGAGLPDVSRSGFSSSYAHTTTFSGDMHIHLNGGSSPRAHAEQVLRELPKVAKARGAQWSPYSR